MEENKILFTGGSGLLGSEMKKVIPSANFPAHQDFDVTNYSQMKNYLTKKDISLIIHAAALKSPPKIDEDPKKGIDSNIIGTSNVVKCCFENDIKLIYISTDYVFDGKDGNYSEDDPVHPVNKYGWSKLGGECAARMYDNSLIVRTSFGENEFPYEKAFVDQYTSRISVSELVKKLALLIDSDLTGTIHIGHKRRSVMEYAKSVSPEKEIGNLSINQVSFNAPKDTSLNTRKFEQIFGETK